MGNDMVITEEMRQMRRVELEILAEFQAVCKKYGLSYYAAGGTLLGAVRHGGFIPWDDDIDVQMMWDDYRKLMELGPYVFRWPLFLQTHRSDTFGEVSNYKLRRSDTTACTQWEFENVKSDDHNRGIFMDIFPLFPITRDEEIRARQKEQIDRCWRAIRGWQGLQSRKAGYASPYEKYIPDYEAMSGSYTIVQIKDLYMEACAMVKGDTEEVGETSFRTHEDKYIWPREWFRETIELPFEDTTVVCPRYYDEVLTRQYGDWRIPVPNSALHEMHVFDAKTPYARRRDLY